MSVRHRAIQVSITAVTCLLLICQASADKSLPLTNEQSRGQLFQEHQREMAGRPAGANQPFAFPANFQFPQHAIFDVDGVQRKTKCLPTPQTCPIFGADISHYEPMFPISELASKNISFIYIKATQGTNYFDRQFDHNWKAAGALVGTNKIPRGAYHFLSSDPKMSGKSQADQFVGFVQAHGGYLAGDLLPALDLEWDVACKGCPDRWQTRKRSPKEIVDTVHDFLAEVRARIGRTPIIYTNKVFLSGRSVSVDDLLHTPTGGKYKVWIFDLDSQDRKVELPNPATNLPHVLWQFSFTGRLPDYSHSFDVNVYKGTATSFQNDLMGTD